MKNIKVFFFDLFFTLIIPKYSDMKNENDVLGLTANEWEMYAEDYELYKKRATGQVVSPESIIEDIISFICINRQIKVSKEQKREVLLLRQNRMRRALHDIDNEIMNTLYALREKGIKIGLISNADVIDSMYWEESPLSKVFDVAVFSHEVGYLKPDRNIYIRAMQRIAAIQKIAAMPQITATERISTIQRMHVKPAECCFVGDGGSNELYGAKQAGMVTVFSEYLEKKSEEKRKEILKYADFHISEFRELTNL